MTEPGSKALAHLHGRPLSARETSILIGIASGRRTGAIAAELYLSQDTVRTHVQRILAKLGAHDRAHAVAIAYRRGILGAHEAPTATIPTQRTRDSRTR